MTSRDLRYSKLSDIPRHTMLGYVNIASGHSAKMFQKKRLNGIEIKPKGAEYQLPSLKAEQIHISPHFKLIDKLDGKHLNDTHAVLRKHSKLNVLLETKANIEVIKSHDANKSNTEIKSYFDKKEEDTKNDAKNSSEMIKYGSDKVSQSFLRMKYFNKSDIKPSESSQNFEHIHEPLKAHSKNPVTSKHIKEWIASSISKIDHSNHKSGVIQKGEIKAKMLIYSIAFHEVLNVIISKQSKEAANLLQDTWNEFFNQICHEVFNAKESHEKMLELVNRFCADQAEDEQF